MAIVARRSGGFIGFDYCAIAFSKHHQRSYIASHALDGEIQLESSIPVNFVSSSDNLQCIEHLPSIF
jgi:hypothetical protein